MKNLKLSKNRTMVIFFALLALIASGAIYFLLIGNMTDVITVNQTVRGGTQITEEILSVEKLDRSALPDNYVTADNKDEIIGKYLDLGLTSGGVLTETNISTSGKASLIPTGHTLYAIKDMDVYPKGLMTGDRLNIVVSTNLEEKGKSVLTFQNILITNITYDEEKVLETIEVQVTPEQAQMIAFGQANGEITLSLLPLDYETHNMPILDEGSFQQAVSEGQTSSGEANTQTPDTPAE